MSESQAERSSATCYRHPDRPSYILCQRCGRTICPQCQTQAAVGVQCPECVREGRASAPRRSVGARLQTLIGTRGGQPVVTWSLIAITVAVFVSQQVTQAVGFPIVDYYGVFRPGWLFAMPWTPITALFLHGSVLHILFNMYSLFVFGPILEQMLGRVRFLALYLVAGLGGSVAVAVLAPGGGVLGASGAIFGLMGAYFVIARRLGGNNVQILLVIGLNLVAGFFISNVSWQAHMGGLITGCVIAAVYLATRRIDQRRRQAVLVGVVAAVLVAIMVARMAALTA